MTRVFRLFCALVLGMGLAPAAAQEDGRLVVLELFTSQGCDRCPPVEQMLQDLSDWPDLLPLALHVDYWDYMGWTDQFALPEHKARQMAYLPQTERRRLFTPLLMIGGLDAAEGYAPMKVMDRIAAHRAVQSGVTLTVRAHGGEVEVQAVALAPFAAPAQVLVVTYLPKVEAQIAAGQNAGRDVTHTNVVTGWQDLGAWDGRGAFAARIPRPSDAGAVLVQAANTGLILEAARID